MSQGQENRILAFCAETRVDQRAGIKGKAHGIFCSAIMCRNLVTAAASHSADKSFGKEGKAKPVLIFKTVAFGRIKGQVRLVLIGRGKAWKASNPGGKQTI